jgi:pimeloyl-ACP methyl ester carboxylesterase
VAFALRSPTRVRSLVLADPYIAGHVFAVPLTDPPFWRVTRSEGAAAARKVWLRAEAMRAVQDPVLRPRIEAMVDAFSTDMWLKGGKEPDHLSRLGEITAPTLAIVAERDPQDFWDVADLAVARIPGARRVVIPDSGHLSNLENPDAFNAAVGEFLAAVTTAQPA